MAKHKFQKGNSYARGKGRPPGSGYRQELNEALKRYGLKRFFDETLEMSKREPTIRVALLKKVIPDLIDNDPDNKIGDWGKVLEKFLNK